MTFHNTADNSYFLANMMFRILCLILLCMNFSSASVVSVRRDSNNNNDSAYHDSTGLNTNNLVNVHYKNIKSSRGSTPKSGSLDTDFLSVEADIIQNKQKEISGSKQISIENTTKRKEIHLKQKENKSFDNKLQRFIRNFNKRDALLTQEEEEPSFCTSGECHTTVSEVKDMCRNCDQVCHYVPSSGVMGFIKCGCYHGFAIGSDWQHCLDIDECSVNPLLCYNGDCLNTIGSFICRCQSGYKLIEHVCVDIDECSTGRATCDQICSNVPGTFQCGCYKGYSLSGSIICQDIDECKYNVCSHFCRNTQGSFLCYCPSHMKLHFDRRTCISFGINHHIKESKKIVLMYSNNGKLESDSIKPLTVSQSTDQRHVIIHDHDDTAKTHNNYGKQNFYFKAKETKANHSSTLLPPDYKQSSNKSNKKQNKKFHEVHHQNVIYEYNLSQRQNKNHLQSDHTEEHPKHSGYHKIMDLPKNIKQTNETIKSKLDITTCENSNCARNSTNRHDIKLNHCHLLCRNGGKCNNSRKCTCRHGFRGRYCQIDVNECLEFPTYCDYLCMNFFGGFKCVCPDGYILLDDQKSCILDETLAQEVHIYVTNSISYIEITPSFESEIIVNSVKETPTIPSVTKHGIISEDTIKLSNLHSSQLEVLSPNLLQFSSAIINENNDKNSSKSTVHEKTFYESDVSLHTSLGIRMSSAVHISLLETSILPSKTNQESVISSLYNNLYDNGEIPHLNFSGISLGIFPNTKSLKDVFTFKPSSLMLDNEAVASVTLADNNFTSNLIQNFPVSASSQSTSFIEIPVTSSYFNTLYLMNSSIINVAEVENVIHYSNPVLNVLETLFTFIFGSSPNTKDVYTTVPNYSYKIINSVTDIFTTTSSININKFSASNNKMFTENALNISNESTKKSVSNPLYFVDVSSSLPSSVNSHRKNISDHNTDIVSSNTTKSTIVLKNGTHIRNTLLFEKENQVSLYSKNMKHKEHKPTFRNGIKRKKKGRQKLIKLSNDFQVLSQVLELASNEISKKYEAASSSSTHDTLHNDQSDYYFEFIDYDVDENGTMVESTTSDASSTPMTSVSWNITKFPDWDISKWKITKFHETDCYYGMVKVKSGTNIFLDSKNCSKCFCKMGKVVCEDIVCKPLDCREELQIIPHSECCPVCLPSDYGCFSRGRFFNEGHLWIKQEHGCHACLCKENRIHCKPIICSVDCEYPQFSPGECCPICRDCQHYEQKYSNEQEFQHPIDLCSVCKCQDGNITCYALPCSINCTDPYKIPGECCPSCSDCQLDGRKIMNGEKILINNGSCHQCSCSNGNVTCIATSCPSDCVVENRVITSGSEFHIGLDLCTKCHCWNGIVTCKAVECHASCSHGVLLPNECCLDCSSCDYEGRLYGEMETFYHIEDKCKLCQCTKGNVNCVNTCKSNAV